MALFEYDSYSRRGKRVKGTIEAPSLPGAKEMLQGQGLMPISIKETSPTVDRGFSLRRLFEKKVDTKTKILFTKQLAVLLKSGVPLLPAIELLTEQFEGAFHRTLVSIKDDLKSGEGLAAGMSKFPKIFPNVYIQLVRAGEASGKLEVILDRLTTYLETSEETKKRIKKALAYPMMILTFAGIVIIAMITFIVPRITGTFVQMGKELPGPTQFLMTLSDMLLHNYLKIIIISFILISIFVYWKSTASGRRRLDLLFLKFPMTSYFARTKAVVQFCTTLGMLLDSGVNFAEALDIVSKIVDNTILKSEIEKARDKIIKEGKIAKYLQETGMFPKLGIYMISTGEESGKLAEMLLSVGRDYDTELAELTDALVGKINPIMMALLGGIVTFIVLAIFLPIMQMGDMPGM